MNSQTNFKFGKSFKLCSETKISELFRTGAVIYNYPLKVYHRENGLAYPKVVLSVPKRSFKRAVDRNFIKRRIREALRLNNFTDEVQPGRDISIVYIGKELPKSDILTQKIKDVLEKIKKGCKDTDIAAIHPAD